MRTVTGRWSGSGWTGCPSLSVTTFSETDDDEFHENDHRFLSLLLTFVFEGDGENSSFFFENFLAFVIQLYTNFVLHHLLLLFLIISCLKDFAETVLQFFFFDNYTVKMEPFQLVNSIFMLMIVLKEMLVMIRGVMQEEKEESKDVVF